MATKPDNSSSLPRSAAPPEPPKRSKSSRPQRREFVRQDRANPSDANLAAWEAKQDYFSDASAPGGSGRLSAPNQTPAMRALSATMAAQSTQRSQEPLEYITVEPDSSEEAIRDKDTVSITCIWLHGLGADGNDLAQIPKLFKFPEQFSFRHIFPHAPMRSVTANGGVKMRAWYDMRSLPPRFNDNMDDIADSTSQVLDLMASGPEGTRYYLIGFSQGGCLALNIALAHGERIAGALAMSCYLANKEVLSTLRPGYICPPIFLSHGKYDPVVPFEELDNTANLIRPYCSDLVLRRYRCGHSIESDTVRDINYWFNNRL